MNNVTLSRNLAGIGIILLGVVGGLGALGTINFEALWNTWWPMLLLIAAGIIWLANPSSWGWPLILIIFGTAGLVRTLGLNTDFNPFTLFWPAVLVIVGISVLRGKRPDTSSGSSEDDVMVIMAGNNVRSTSNDYKGGKATAIMGGIELDLRKATIKKQAVLNVTAFWGGIDIKVPETWRIKNQTNAALGGVEIKTVSSVKADAPVLVLTGDIVMGGVEVKT